jgi:two-component system, LytTR family, sensor kinase
MVYTLFGIVNNYLTKKWNIQYVLLSIFSLYAICILVFIPLKKILILTWLYDQPIEWQTAFSFFSLLSTFFVLFITSSFAITAKFVRIIIKQKEIEKEIIKSKLDTELQFLKSQTNPHFLFNTLNNIYVLARKKSELTAPIVMKLSNLLRFTLYESQNQLIFISEEIKVIENYIELEKVRFNENLKITFNQKVENYNQEVAPLVLLPFVENAFKHGAGENRYETNIKINLTLKNSLLTFQIENDTSTVSEVEIVEKIGLSNVRRQLELLYPDHYLEINKENQKFIVILKLQLK